jgi:hypothetical protein
VAEGGAGKEERRGDDRTRKRAKEVARAAGGKAAGARVVGGRGVGSKGGSKPRVGGKGHAKGNGCDGYVWRYGAGK